MNGGTVRVSPALLGDDEVSAWVTELEDELDNKEPLHGVEPWRRSVADRVQRLLRQYHETHESAYPCVVTVHAAVTDARPSPGVAIVPHALFHGGELTDAIVLNELLRDRGLLDVVNMLRSFLSADCAMPNGDREVQARPALDAFEVLYEALKSQGCWGPAEPDNEGRAVECGSSSSKTVTPTT